MNTQKLAAKAKSKLQIITALVVLCLMVMANTSYAQARASEGSILAPFGVTLKDNSTNITLDEMIKNPVMLLRRPGFELLEFTISYLPEGKDYRGPFRISGSPRLPGMALETLQTMKDNGDKKIRVFIENIKAKEPDGAVRILVPVTFTSKN
jgi:hypothetical protein